MTPAALPPRRSIVLGIVEQHAAEAAFLWSLRDAGIDQSHYALRHLADLEARVEAHIDGLRIAGEAGLEIAWIQLGQFSGAGELFVLATLALETHDRGSIERAIQFSESAPESYRGLFAALGWVSRDTLRGHVVTWLESAVAFRRLIGVVACSLHRADPGSRIERLLVDEPSIRRRALRLVGELGRMDLRKWVRLALDDEDDACRFWAAWSAGLLGERMSAIPVLKTFVVADGRFKWRALDMVLRLMGREAATDWLKDLGRTPDQARLLVAAAGIIGDPVTIPWLIQKMSVPALARLAGESLSIITGVDFSERGLVGKPPADFLAGPTDDPSDNSIAIDVDENLTWPDPVKIQVWWEKERGRFAPGMRHLRGMPLTSEACKQVWREGDQRQRSIAAYELALTEPGSALWNWLARANA